MLRVTEIFRSIQGESTHAGRPCAFVRLTGCPMRCTWCDSEYTFSGGERVSMDDVMRQVRAYGCQLVEVTGGEPLAQKGAYLGPGGARRLMGGSPNDKDFIYDDEPEAFAGVDESAAVENPAGKSSAAQTAHDAMQTDEQHSSLIAHDSTLPLAVCLVSGGMDSCVTAAIAREENGELAFLHVSYGQRTEARERRAFEELADFYGVQRRLVVSLEHLARIGGSSLTDPSIPVSEADLASRHIPTSYVPFRNAHLLAAATSWAEVEGARRIYIGAVAEDSSGYPDCRPEFYEAFQRVIDVGTRPETRLEIRTPVISLSQAEIVRRGASLDAPLRLTWSCYQAEERACGRCDSCAPRLRAFREAGMEDPIPYA